MKAGESVTVSVNLTNSGGSRGDYPLVLKINDVEEGRQRITLDAGASEMVSFLVTKERAGDYQVDVNGRSGRFIVEEAEPPWLAIWLFGAVGVVIVIGLVVYLSRRRRHSI